MITISGADLVLPDRILPSGVLEIDGDRIGRIGSSGPDASRGGRQLELNGGVVLPGFIDGHVHGVEGIDTLDGGGAVAALASRLPRYGVTAFAPTAVACAPDLLRSFLQQVRTLRSRPDPAAAHVLPAHIESPFIAPAFCGAQPMDVLMLPSDGHEVRAVIAAFEAEVGTVTLAPELPGALDLIRDLVARGHRVSLGHSAATFEQALAGLDAGADRVTHLFNRMAPLAHREPGLPGAVLDRAGVFVELVCDGRHVHPAVCRLVMAAKGAETVVAVSDGTACAGLPEGAVATLGGRSISLSQGAARLADGTLAGSAITMAGVFRVLVQDVGCSIVDAARLCATTPARALGLDDVGRLVEGAIADLVVLDQRLRVLHTFVAGREIYTAGPGSGAAA